MVTPYCQFALASPIVQVKTKKTVVKASHKKHKQKSCLAIQHKPTKQASMVRLSNPHPSCLPPFFKLQLIIAVHCLIEENKKQLQNIIYKNMWAPHSVSGNFNYGFCSYYFHAVFYSDIIYTADWVSCI